MLKKPRGRNGGRKPKYTEPLVHFTTRVPASKVDELKSIIDKMKAEIKRLP